MKGKKITLLFFPIFFIKAILSENKVYYISTTGNSNNEGTEDSPWNFNWDTISNKLRKAFDNSNRKDTYTLYFLQGDYYVDGYGISLSKMYGEQYIRFWAAPGAKVRIIGGKKLPSLCCF